MKVAILSGASSIHTIRWANGLQAAGHEVHVISQHEPCDSLNEGITLHQFPSRGIFGYFTMVPSVRKLLNEIKPDVVNAHYASGYATTARLVGHRPWLLSVWGSDVYDFPYQSPFHHWLVRKNILAADAVASTSHCMAKQTRAIAPQVGEIAITPFGVDMSAYQTFSPTAQVQAGCWVIGTVKSMAEKYGIDTLINAFALLYRKLLLVDAREAEKLKLRLVGDGPQLSELKQLTVKLGVADRVEFTGRVPHTHVAKELAGLDIYVALSRLDSESFGVAIIEAGAAGRPVVVSDAGGLPEVTVHGVTGLVVPRENPQAAADAIEILLRDASLRQKMGFAAQKHVAEHYCWDECVQKMLEVYRKVITSYQQCRL